jgi:hypothetical protein
MRALFPTGIRGRIEVGVICDSDLSTNEIRSRLLTLQRNIRVYASSVVLFLSHRTELSPSFIACLGEVENERTLFIGCLVE